MIPKDTFNDKEIQVIKVSLQVVSEILQERIKLDKPYKPLNEYDLYDPKHTLMHILTSLSKLTKSPIQSFQNPIQAEDRAPLTDLPQAS